MLYYSRILFIYLFIYFLGELRENGIGYVADKYRLYDKYHKEHPNLVLFKYKQQGSPFGVPSFHILFYII